MSKPLSSLLSAVDVLACHGRTDRGIAGIAYDSRTVHKGYLFFAFPGLHADGHEYIEAAIGNGAVAILHDRTIDRFEPGITYVRVKDTRLAMSPVARAFYDNPSASLLTIGVTGTEGKSTTVYLIYQLLKLSGFKAGFFSTVMSDTGSGEKPNPEHQTTPEAPAVQRQLASMRDAGCEFAVVESSSHGLSPRTGRLADVDFDIGIMTNVTHEHLEFHGTWEQYRSDKANLFRNLDGHGHEKKIGGRLKRVRSCGIVNADDPSSGYFAKATEKPVFSYSTRGASATFMADGIVSDESGCSFVVEGPGSLSALPPFVPPCAALPESEPAATPAVGGSGGPRRREKARINLPGEFNVGNCLAALIAVSAATDTPWIDLLPLLPALKPVRGRMMGIDCGQPFEVIIDYAHTPSSFAAILPSLRARVKGRLFCLFGSAGERDTEKRPQQGLIASKYCDVLILTDEDPRGEDPTALLEDIARGCPDLPRGERLFLIPDRPRAIRKAFSMAAQGDAVLLLGKGHENSIIYKDFSMPYDEETEATRALGEMGYLKQTKAIN